MDFYLYYSFFLRFFDFIKKKVWITFSMFCFLIVMFLFFYVKRCFELESASAFIDFIEKDDYGNFVKNPQHGIYEDIRTSIINKKILNQKFINKLYDINPIFYKYIRFSCQMNGLFEFDSEDVFSKDFDSIFESRDNPWSNLFISSKVFYDRIILEERSYPFFLNLYTQYMKGVKR